MQVKPCSTFTELECSSNLFCRTKEQGAPYIAPRIDVWHSFHICIIIQNAAARVLTNTKKVDHISPVLKSLHWLPVCQRIDFKVLLLVYKALNGLGPTYINELL